MPMQKHTIRWPPYLIDLLRREAAIDGVDVATFVRDSVLLRIGYRAGARGESKETVEMFERIVRESRKG